jgi:outer membrane lipoprotein-sorting protein
MRRRTLIALVTAALLVTSGCASVQVLGTDAEQSPPDADVIQRLGSLETLEATRAATVDYNGSVNETKSVIRLDRSTSPPEVFRRVLAPDDRAGDVSVYNESVSLQYDASENTVTRRPNKREHGASVYNFSEYVASIVAAARDGDTDTADTVSPLPMVPASSDTAQIPAEKFDEFRVEYLGTDTVAGRVAHGFEVTGTSEAALSMNQTLWLDSEYFYPLQVDQRVELENRTYEAHVALTAVSFNPALDEDAFAFDVPENATVERANVTTETVESPAALRDATNTSVPAVDAPDGYSFESASVVTDEFTRVSIRYASDGDALTVTKMTDIPAEDSVFTAGEKVTVAGQTAHYLTTGQSKQVSWRCSGVQYSVVASGLERDELLAVAESVACE